MVFGLFLAKHPIKMRSDVWTKNYRLERVFFTKYTHDSRYIALLNNLLDGCFSSNSSYYRNLVFSTRLITYCRHTTVYRLWIIVFTGINKKYLKENLFIWSSLQKSFILIKSFIFFKSFILLHIRAINVRSKFVEISDHLSELKFYHIENSILPHFFGSKSVNDS